MSVFNSLAKGANRLLAKANEALDASVTSKDTGSMNNHALLQFHINLFETIGKSPVVRLSPEERKRVSAYVKKLNDVSDEVILRFDLKSSDTSRFTFEKLHGDAEGVENIRHAISYFPVKLRNPTTINVFLDCIGRRINTPITEEEKRLAREKADQERKQKRKLEEKEAKKRHAEYYASPEFAERQAKRIARGLPPIEVPSDKDKK